MQNLEESKFDCKKNYVIKEKAFRDTQIRSMHETGELKRAQELLVDKFSEQKFRESHETIQKLISQIQELQERVNCMNGSGDFQDMESSHSRFFSRSQPTSSHSKSTFYAKPRQTLATWYMEFVGIGGKRFWQSAPYVRFTTDPS